MRARYCPRDYPVARAGARRAPDPYPLFPPGVLTRWSASPNLSLYSVNRLAIASSVSPVSLIAALFSVSSSRRAGGSLLACNYFAIMLAIRNRTDKGGRESSIHLPPQEVLGLAGNRTRPVSREAVSHTPRNSQYLRHPDSTWLSSLHLSHQILPLPDSRQSFRLIPHSTHSIRKQQPSCS